MAEQSEILTIAPRLTGDPFSQAEALGSAVWLWMHSDYHKGYPLHTLHTLLLPAITEGQFILGIQNNRPVFYLSWALFSEEAEARYLSNPLVDLQPADWRSGHRTWILDWISPFGHSRKLLRLVEKLLRRHCVRWMYHKGDGSRDIIKEFWGIAVPKEEAKYWFNANPPLTPEYLASRKTQAL